MNFKRSLKNNLLLGICLILIGYIVISSDRAKVVKITPAPTPTTIPIQTTFTKVIKVYDGDTIQIEGGMKVRYIGIDAAEVYPVRGCFAEEAKKENERLVLGKDVKLVKDTSETDKYGRLLRYVYVGDKFVNEELVKSGYAKVMTVLPDTKHKNEFLNSENYARENNLGLWNKCQPI